MEIWLLLLLGMSLVQKCKHVVWNFLNVKFAARTIFIIWSSDTSKMTELIIYCSDAYLMDVCKIERSNHTLCLFLISLLYLLHWKSMGCSICSNVSSSLFLGLILLLYFIPLNFNAIEILQVWHLLYQKVNLVFNVETDVQRHKTRHPC